MDDKNISIFTYFKKILVINLIGFGGAPLSVGYYTTSFVDSNLITTYELNQYVALGNILPGAMSFYVSGFIGLKLFKTKGLILGVFTCVFPIMLVTILVYNLLLLTNLNLEYLILPILPLLIVNSLKYFDKVLKQKLSPILKWSLFTISLLLLFLTAITSIELVLLFVFFTIIYGVLKKEENVIS